jgi:hypothetical protein
MRRYANRILPYFVWVMNQRILGGALEPVLHLHAGLNTPQVCSIVCGDEECQLPRDDNGSLDSVS